MLRGVCDRAWSHGEKYGVDGDARKIFGDCGGDGLRALETAVECIRQVKKEPTKY